MNYLNFNFFGGIFISESDILKSINSDIVIDFDSEKQAKIVYESIFLEFKTSPDYRSSMDLKLDKNTIIITIDAEDATSFRASINSAIKWIKLSVEINELAEN
ncbi:KEOPS complex subunit Pcc1 [Methanobrevibacter olleyae]|uniref:KEOPS complex subunit Pcc1 n=1 Tax=Methanobrevibacter olleyae TaxID=294671 RepID=UPI001F46B26D|nr:KEOPS complex subunit Pcc1 [Methanobrevibacter olleyae]